MRHSHISCSVPNVASIHPRGLNRRVHFPEDLDLGIRGIAYRRRRVTAIDSHSVTEESIEVFRIQAKIDICDTLRAPELGLHQAHRDFGRILRDKQSSRQDNLHELAEKRAETSIRDVESHL